MGVASKTSLYQSPRDKQLRELLGDPAVDDAAAAEHVRAACAEIQSHWTVSEEKKRRRWSLGPSVEVHAFSSRNIGNFVVFDSEWVTQRTEKGTDGK